MLNKVTYTELDKTAIESACSKAWERKFKDFKKRHEEKLQISLAESDRINKQAGRKEGLKQGLEKGLELGKKEGRQEAKLAIAKMMLQQGFEPITVQEIIGLSEEQIENLRDKTSSIKFI